MKRPTASRLAWTLVGVSVPLITLGIFLSSRGPDAVGALEVVLFVLSSVAFPVVGALIIARHPRHPIGWIFVAAGLISVLQTLFAGYGTFALERESPIPGGVIASWLADIIWLPSIALSTTFLFLLFPDGRLLSKRWRPIAWMAVVGTALSAIAAVFEPTLYDRPGIRAPLALPADARWIVERLFGVSFFLWLSATIGAVISLIVRLRRARGDERQQVKWFAFAAVAALGALIPLFVVESPEAYALFGGIALLAIPTSVGIAILKYRLYDIDRIINRTLVYGALTALLIGVYVAAAVGFGALVRSVTGQENNSLVIAASTLAVAAVFGPARRRIQAFIDRRFYRRKYDAARTLETFSVKLREQVDLDSLSGELVGVVRDTMQPVHVSLWLRRTELER